MAHARGRQRLVGAVVAACLVLVACDGAGGSDDRSDGGDVAGGGDADQEQPTRGGEDAGAADGLAALGIIEPGVDVAGFAELRWTEGALARIDVDTLFEVTELDLATGQPRVTTRLDAGRVWNRLQEGSADYEVVTDVGTAAVRGTGFLISCTETCTFGLAEGVLAVTTALGIELELRPGEQVGVDGDGAPADIEPFRWTGQGYTTSWIDRPAGSCPDGTPRWEEDFVLTLTPTAVSDGDAGVVTELDARWVSTLTPLPSAVESGCDPGAGEVDQVLTGSGVLAEGASAN